MFDACCATCNLTLANLTANFLAMRWRLVGVGQPGQRRSAAQKPVSDQQRPAHHHHTGKKTYPAETGEALSCSRKRQRYLLDGLIKKHYTQQPNNEVENVFRFHQPILAERLMRSKNLYCLAVVGAPSAARLLLVMSDYGRSNHQHANRRSPGKRSESMGWAGPAACSLRSADWANNRSLDAAQDLPGLTVSLAPRQDRKTNGLHRGCPSSRGDTGEARARRRNMVARERGSSDHARQAFSFRRGRLSGIVVRGATALR